MPKLLPDQSFYPSPTMAMQAPAETLAYVALLNPDPPRATPLPCWISTRVARLRRPDRARRTCPAPATSCTTSDGTLAARACARTRRTRTWSGAIW